MAFAYCLVPKGTPALSASLCERLSVRRGPPHSGSLHAAHAGLSALSLPHSGPFLDTLSLPPPFFSSPRVGEGDPIAGPWRTDVARAMVWAWLFPLNHVPLSRGPSQGHFLWCWKWQAFCIKVAFPNLLSVLAWSQVWADGPTVRGFTSRGPGLKGNSGGPRSA